MNCNTNLSLPPVSCLLMPNVLNEIASAEIRYVALPVIGLGCEKMSSYDSYKLLAKCKSITESYGVLTIPIPNRQTNNPIKNRYANKTFESITELTSSVNSRY